MKRNRRNASAGPFLLLLIVLIPPQPADGVGSTSTVAVVQNSNSTTVCGIIVVVREAIPRSIICASYPNSSKQTVVSLLPNTSFLAISGGRDFLCGLRHDSDAVFCWSTVANFTAKRIYYGNHSLDSLAVGEDHLAAGVREGCVSFWRVSRDFPRNVTGRFKSVTSGNGFSCGVDVGGYRPRVRCWGNRNGVARRLESEFRNLTIKTTLVAGDSHMCGITANGGLICKGSNKFGQLGSSNSSSPFEFSALALGSTHTCAVRRLNGTVVCWGGGEEDYVFPIGDLSVEVITAGGNLTCGVVTRNLSVVCWELKREKLLPPSVSVLPFPQILPGFCSGEYLCICGVFPDSARLCSNSGVICRSCDDSFSSISLPQPPPEPAPKRKFSKWYLVSIVVGSIGGLIGAISVVFYVTNGVCKQRKVHNSVQPTIGSGVVGHSSPPGSPFSSPSKSVRTRSARFLRQGSRMMKMKRQRSGPSSSMRERAEVFSYLELAEATGNFSPETKIGSGSFGTVYKGKLADGREVAIKRSESGPKTKKFQEKEVAFQSELAFLSRLHHKHLTALVGYCEEGEERLLVYEYMKNGSLHDHLHITSTEITSTSACSHNLLNTWKLRIGVLLDASRGIEYLHNYAVPHIIHRDIKSSNILLDANWTARVSDFGLSLHGPAPPNASMKTAGTVGYMDPEYYGLHTLTEKSDVYGLGVVMLEVITGKRAVFREGNQGDPLSIVEYAVPHIANGELGAILDKRMGASKAGDMEAVELVAYTAMHCVKLEGRERPAMSDVVANLENAVAMCDHSSGHVSFSSASIISLE